MLRSSNGVELSVGVFSVAVRFSSLSSPGRPIMQYLSALYGPTSASAVGVHVALTRTVPSSQLPPMVPPVSKPRHRIEAVEDDQSRIQRLRRPIAAFASLRGYNFVPREDDNDDGNIDPLRSFHTDDDNNDNNEGQSDTTPLEPPISTVHRRILNFVGDPATADTTHFPTRSDLQISPSYPLHVDLGGEGRFTAHGTTCGFASSINVNARRTNSQLRGRAIPNLIRVADWALKPPIPLGDGMVDYVTVQSAPLTEHNVDEMCRVLRPDGCVGLWIDLEAPAHDGTTSSEQDNCGSDGGKITNLDMAYCLAERLGSTLEYSRSSVRGKKVHTYGDHSSHGECRDEFNGRYPFPKLCIWRNQK